MMTQSYSLCRRAMHEWSIGASITLTMMTFGVLASIAALVLKDRLWWSAGLLWERGEAKLPKRD